MRRLRDRKSWVAGLRRPTAVVQLNSTQQLTSIGTLFAHDMELQYSQTDQFLNPLSERPTLPILIYFINGYRLLHILNKVTKAKYGSAWQARPQLIPTPRTSSKIINRVIILVSCPKAMPMSQERVQERQDAMPREYCMYSVRSTGT
jgi:hypothetical protein